MRPVQSQTLTATGTSTPVALDPRGWANSTGIELVITGTATAKVQYTLDDIFDPNYTPSSGVWFDSSITGTSVNAAGSINFPVSAIRVNCTAYTSGNVYLRAYQGSTDGG